MAGRPPKLTPDDLRVFESIIQEHPTDSHRELIQRLFQATGKRVCSHTTRNALARLGFHRQIPQAPAKESQADDPKSPPYKYKEVHRRKGSSTAYPTDLTDQEWDLVKDLFQHRGPGIPGQEDRRELLNACVYLVRTGCSWRMLPKHFPYWQNVYGYFRRWADAGVFEQMHDRLRAMWREREGRSVSPTGAVIDSQSVKTTEQGGPRGFDAGKKTKGRKRHLVVDTLGLVLAVLVTTASTQDRDGARPVIEAAKGKYPSIAKIYADGGYAGKESSSISNDLGLDIEIVRHPANKSTGSLSKQLSLDLLPAPPRGFQVLPMRWIVERTHAWNDKFRRLSKEWDRRIDVSTAWIWLAEGRLLLNRVANS